MKHKYDITIEVYQECEFSGDYCQWLGYTDIQSYGNTLDELLDNATIGISDQNGEEHSVIDCDEDWMIDLIVHEIYLQYGEIYDFNTVNTSFSV